VLIVGWLITAALGALVVARVVAFDHGRLLLVANSLTYWIFLPEYVVLAVAIAARRYALVACAAVVVLAHVVIVWPSLREPVPIPRSAYRAPRLRLFAGNVLFDNPHPDGIIHEIDASDADVVMLEEFTQRWQDALEQSPLWDEYPLPPDHTARDHVAVGHVVEGALGGDAHRDDRSLAAARGDRAHRRTSGTTLRRPPGCTRGSVIRDGVPSHTPSPSRSPTRAAGSWPPATST